MIHQVVTKGKSEIKVLAETSDFNEAFKWAMAFESGETFEVDGKLGTIASVGGECKFVERGNPVWVAHTGSGEF